MTGLRGSDNIALLYAWDGSAWQALQVDASKFLKVALQAGTVAIGKLAANNDGVYIGDIKFGEALPAGDNNIGNVDLASAIPAGENLIGDVEIRPNRSSSLTTLIDGTVFDDDPTSENSSNVDTDNFRKFTLYLNVDSTDTPTTVQFIVQFSDDGGTTYYDYKQGLFASLYYEDADTASGITECFSGDCAGRDFRLRVVAVGTDATHKFTVTAKVEFWS